MTATTPPISAWYVLEVEGTGLASARTEGDKTEETVRMRQRLLLVPRVPWGAHPALLGSIGSILLQTRAGSEGREGSGGSEEGKATAVGVGSWGNEAQNPRV